MIEAKETRKSAARIVRTRLATHRNVRAAPVAESKSKELRTRSHYQAPRNRLHYLRQLQRQRPNRPRPEIPPFAARPNEEGVETSSRGSSPSLQSAAPTFDTSACAPTRLHSGNAAPSPLPSPIVPRQHPRGSRARLL